MKTKAFAMARSDGSRNYVLFQPDPDDPHFFNVVLKSKRSGVAICSHYILTSDVPQWVGMDERDGYKIEK